MFQYEGPGDVTQMVQGDLFEEKLNSHIHTVTNTTIKDISVHGAMEPFCSDNPPGDVSFLLLQPRASTPSSLFSSQCRFF